MKKSKIRLLFIITGLSTGGAELMLLRLLQNMDRDKFSLQVISLTTFGDVGDHISDLNIPVFALGIKPSLPNPFRLFRLFKLIRQFNPHIVQTWMYHADLLGGLAAYISGCKNIVWGIRGTYLTGANSKNRTVLVAKICALLSTWLPKKILTCSFRAKDHHISFGYSPVKFSVIPNGFELRKFQANSDFYEQVRVELGLSPTAILIGHVGRYDPQKNHLGFIHAATLVLKKRPEINFVLIGSGVTRENSFIWGQILKSGFPGNFHLLGRRDDMPRLFASFDLLVSSSISEAFPNVLGEAMASSVPCVVTDAGDSIEIVGNAGRVVAEGDMNALADGVLQMLSLSQSELNEFGSVSRKRIKECFDIDRIASSYQDYYRNLLLEVG